VIDGLLLLYTYNALCLRIIVYSILNSVSTQFYNSLKIISAEICVQKCYSLFLGVIKVLFKEGAETSHPKKF